MLKLVKKYLSHLAWETSLENKHQLLSLLEVNRQAKVLDIGCGDGLFTRMIAGRIGSDCILGIEINEKIARQARKINYIDTVIADASKPFPFRDNSFDLLIANQLIEHLYDTDIFVKEMYRILRPAGICVCSTPNLASFHNVFCLILGYQPYASHVSDEAGDCGTLFGNLYPRNPYPYPGEKHRRIFTARALKGLFQLHGFKCKSLVGCGIYPLPLSICRWLKLPKYSAYITYKFGKPSKNKVVG